MPESYFKYLHAVITLLWALSSLQAQQDTTIFAPTGATWYYSTWVGSPYPELLKFVVEGEIELNDTIASVLKFYSGESGELIAVDGLEKYVFTSGDQVYYWVHDGFYLLYDFGAETGDTITSRVEDFPYSLSCWGDFSGGPFNFSYTIDSIGTIQIDGQILRTQYVTPLFTDDIGWIIESPVIERFGQFNQSAFWWGRGQGCSLGGFPGELRCYEDEDLFFKNPFTQFDLECDYITGVEDLVEKPFLLYPNPASDFIQLPAMSQIISLYNCEGQKISSYNDVDQIEISNLSSGVYFVHYQYNDYWHTERFIKQ